MKRSKAMNPWRLEWLRLTRSPRGVALALVYLFLGFAGPLMAKYMPSIAEHAASGIKIIVPEPTPADGIANYVNQAGQTGLIVVLAIAAGPLSIDARRGLSIFHRTRARNAFALLWPRYVAAVGAAVVAYTLGVAAAWYGTTVMLGGLPADRMLLATACEAVLLAFAVSVVAAAATFGRGTLATVAVSAVVLLVALPLAGAVGPLRDWVPTALVTVPTRLVPGAAGIDPGASAEAVGDAAKAVVVSIVAMVALLALATWRSTRREV